MKINEYAMIAATFVVGILVIGMAAFGLYNQVNGLEKEYNDVNVSLAIRNQEKIDLETRVNDLVSQVQAKDVSISDLVTRNNTLTTDNNVYQFNYNVAQDELRTQRILMLTTIEDNNRLVKDWNSLELFFDSNYNLNINDDNFTQDFNSYFVSEAVLYDFKDLFFKLRNDFGYCYWSIHCTLDINGCKFAYGLDSDINIDGDVLKSKFETQCLLVTDSDYNKYAAFE